VHRAPRRTGNDAVGTGQKAHRVPARMKNPQVLHYKTNARGCIEMRWHGNDYFLNAFFERIDSSF
jgi:hypothetical protein